MDLEKAPALCNGQRIQTLTKTNLQQGAIERVSRGAVATAFPAATEAVLGILRAGGNAIDAAVAAAWALSVCEPSGSGLGGQTTMLVRTRHGKVTVVDGHSHAPALASLNNISKSAQRVGYRACTIPSTVATLGYAHRKWGVLSLERVMEPAIALAEEGYSVTRLHRRQTKWVTGYLNESPATARLFLRNGTAPEVGEVFRQKELAWTLRRVASQGTDEFYRGEIAALISEDMREHGGLITEGDLKNFSSPVEREPLSIRYRGYRIVTVPPPGGGLNLLLALKVMEHLPADMKDTASWHEYIAETMFEVFLERKRLPVGPAEPTASLVESLAGNEHAKELADCIIRRRTPRNASEFSPLIRPPGVTGDYEPGDTTHLSVTDEEGNIVSLTQSIQSLFGAKVANAKLGFLYNNYLCTCPRDEHPYQLGSRAMPRSNVSPTIVFSGMPGNDPPVLALGAAGSRRITSSALQVISNVLDRRVSLQAAVDAPRIHALLSRKVWIEKPAACEELTDRLRRRFRKVIVKSSRDYKMGAVQAIGFDENGEMYAAADPRRDGASAIL